VVSALGKIDIASEHDYLSEKIGIANEHEYLSIVHCDKMYVNYLFFCQNTVIDSLIREHISAANICN
jgi:hypothetical protein